MRLDIHLDGRRGQLYEHLANASTHFLITEIGTNTGESQITPKALTCVWRGGWPLRRPHVVVWRSFRRRSTWMVAASSRRTATMTDLTTSICRGQYLPRRPHQPSLGVILVGREARNRGAARVRMAGRLDLLQQRGQWCAATTALSVAGSDGGVAPPAPEGTRRRRLKY